ncbi:hypothetical protein OBBRIDRAFT_735571 [Obba rivulosa]|uniref:Integrase core domain-containing protein n=1 Tax=Obba rivulosa TaxID=1052685 RepID=A0A8E2ATE9_9APHY|nr:hypothetical protein OBBRIDRAFT_735571 [Obba rivulosa]
MSHYNRNPTGKNQFGSKPGVDDEQLVNALQKYHREKLTSNQLISKRLKAEYGVEMSATTVKRRRKALRFFGSSSTAKTMPEQDRTQLVLSQMDKDPARRQGVQTIQHRIAFDKGIHLPRDFVSEVMHQYDSEAFKLRDPTAKKIHREPKHPIGIHERWAGDGHDKLYKIGFPIWGVVDDATGAWLGGWVVPSNRLGEVVAYLFLCLVEKFEGIPLQFSTDCGSETTKLYGLISALRQIFYPEIAIEELPAHVFLRSVHNISIERSWLRLRLEFGDNAVIFFQRGEESGVYRPHDPNHYELCQWLWPSLLRQEMDAFMTFRNGVTMRKNNSKPGPSKLSRNTAFSIPEEWGGRNCLLPVDVEVIREIKAAMGGDDLLEFVSSDFKQRAQAAYDSLDIAELTFSNVWDVFAIMLPLVYPEVYQ